MLLLIESHELNEPELLNELCDFALALERLDLHLHFQKYGGIDALY